MSSIAYTFQFVKSYANDNLRNFLICKFYKVPKGCSIVGYTADGQPMFHKD